MPSYDDIVISASHSPIQLERLQEPDTLDTVGKFRESGTLETVRNFTEPGNTPDTVRKFLDSVMLDTTRICFRARYNGCCQKVTGLDILRSLRSLQNHLHLTHLELI
jgi:hypothetical protein